MATDSFMVVIFKPEFDFSRCGFRERLDPHDEEGGGKAKIIFGFFLDVGLEGV